MLPVRHLALPGVRTESLARVISHPLALAQCERTLLAKLTAGGLHHHHHHQDAAAVARVAFFDDTAGAARHVAAGGLRDAAAELYGMEVLDADGCVHDDAVITRFVVLAREPVVVDDYGRRRFKTSIVFAGGASSSSSSSVLLLFKVLAAFAARDIGLARAETRPNYHCVDFQASLAEPRAQDAMAEVQELTSFLRVLGSYPRY